MNLKEQPQVPLPQQRQGPRRHEALLDDQEAVALERRDLLGRQHIERYDRGRVFSGS